MAAPGGAEAAGEVAGPGGVAEVGLGRIIALYHRASTEITLRFIRFISGRPLY